MCSPSQGYYKKSPTARLRALPDKAERLVKANEFIRVIATHGRKFFNHHGTISRLLFDAQGRVSFWDSYSKKYVYAYGNGSWKGFTNGETMRILIVRLREYIQGRIETGDDLFLKLGLTGNWNSSPYHPWYHPWAYPEADMTLVIEAARQIFCSASETHETQSETTP
jgi:hypothetical protein